jgi:hypothetical protein
MKKALLMGGAIAAMLGAAPFAMADGANITSVDSVQVAQAAAGEVDAGKLIGEDVYDANGDKVGDIDSVMVDPKGKVTSPASPRTAPRRQPRTTTAIRS